MFTHCYTVQKLNRDRWSSKQRWHGKHGRTTHEPNARAGRVRVQPCHARARRPARRASVGYGWFQQRARGRGTRSGGGRPLGLRGGAVGGGGARSRRACAALADSACGQLTGSVCSLHRSIVTRSGALRTPRFVLRGAHCVVCVPRHAGRPPTHHAGMHACIREEYIARGSS